MPSRLGLLGVSGPTSVVVPPSSFTPASIYGLERWYYQPNVDYAGGTWVDRALIPINLSQGTAGFRPTLSAVLAELNGKYSVIGDGSDDYIFTTAFGLVQPHTNIAVLRTPTWAASDRIWDGTTTNQGILYQFNAAPQFDMHSGANVIVNVAGATGKLPLNRFGVVTASYNGAASIGRIDGAQGGAGNAGTGSPGGITLMASGGGGSSANVEFSEFLLYRGVVGAYDLVRLWNEWIAADRYNIPTTFNPDSIATLEAWYKADTLALADGANVTSWTDSSGNGRTLTNPGAAPTYKINYLNGRPAVKFVGASSQYLQAAFTNNHPLTVFVVAQANSDAHSSIYDGVVQTSSLIYRGDSTHINVYSNGTFISCVAVPSDFQVISAVFNGASSKGVINGVVTTGTCTALNTGGITLGRNGTGSTYFEGYICEILVYSGALSDSIRQQVEGYLANRWARNAAIRPFDPLSVAGCKGWWRVDGGCDVSADGSGIGALYDRSGNGNHLIEATNKPTYETNELNGLAVARFDGINDKLSGTFGAAVAQPTTILIVHKQASTGSTNNYVDGIVIGSRNALYGDAGFFRYYTSTGISTGVVYDTSWHLQVVNFTGASSKSYFEGITTGAGNPGTGGLTGLLLGCTYDFVSFADCDIAEVILYGATLSDADQKSLEGYLAKRYDIAYKAPNHASLLANLAGWWDASQITGLADGAAVSSWPDMSGNGRHAVQAVGTNQPSYQTLELNGRPCVRFDGVDNFLKTAAFVINQPFLAIVVIKRITIGVAEYILMFTDGSGSGSAQLYNNPAGGNDLKLYAGSAEVNVPGKTAAAIYTLKVNGASSQAWSDGVAGAIANAGAWICNGLTLGATSTPASYADVDIYEVILFNNVPSDADRRAVENYVAQKYNIAV